MPEGDTIFRTATTLSRAIGGKTVRRFRSQLPAVEAFREGIEGRRVERVEPRGKYLLIHFEEGSALLTHMRMTGAWHIYRPGEAWQKSERAARVVIETDDFVAVCFAAPVVEMIAKGAVDRHPALARLGPDVLGEAFDADLARARLRERADMDIADALLSQGALAGIGNVYKSEVLFVCRVDPFVKVAAVTDEVLDALVETARAQMSQNLEGHARTTTFSARGKGFGGPGAGRASAVNRGSGGGPRAFFPARGPRYFVYGRAGEPCLVCGTAVRASRSGKREGASIHAAGGALPASGGEAARVTFFCEKCQPEGATGAVPGVAR